MSVAGVLRIELRHDDLESPALTVTLHPNIILQDAIIISKIKNHGRN